MSDETTINNEANGKIACPLTLIMNKTKNLASIDLLDTQEIKDGRLKINYVVEVASLILFPTRELIYEAYLSVASKQE